MSRMGCNCGNSMWDGDGEIVYDVYARKDLDKYIEGNGINKLFEDIYDDDPDFYADGIYFWLCDKCKTVHLWSNLPEYCYRTFELCKAIDCNISTEEIKKLAEFYVINSNEYGDIESMPITDIMEKNPLRPFKYYVTEDLTKVFIINTDHDKVDRIYELTHESNVEYDLKTESFGHLLIYTIDKKNGGHEYKVEKGIRIQQDSEDYPYKQVNFMVSERPKGGGLISYADPNREPETYTADTMDEFYAKYGYLYKQEGPEK